MQKQIAAIAFERINHPSPSASEPRSKRPQVISATLANDPIRFGIFIFVYLGLLNVIGNAALFSQTARHG